MGVVAITSNLGDGEYTVDVQRDMVRATALKTKLETEVIKLEVALLANAGAISVLKSEIIQIRADIDSSIDSINSDNNISQEEKASAIREAIKEDTEEFIRLSTKLDSRERFGADGQYSIDAKNNKIQAITEKLNEVITRDLWCVDYSLDFNQEEEKVSLEVGRENDVLFIAPYTYVVLQEDIDDENAVLSIKNTIKSGLEAEKIQSEDQKLFAKNQIVYLKSLISETQQPEELALLKARLTESIEDLLKWTQRVKALEASIIKAQGSIDNTQARIDALTGAGIGNIVMPIVNDNTKKLQPVISNGASGTYWNKALLPGIQRYIPTYRTGVITEITGDYCTVLLDETRSTQQNYKTLELFNINIDNTDKNNLTPILTDVPIRYGICNGAVFDVDDAVVVSYEERDNGDGEIKLRPKVIGFTENPLPCLIILARHAEGEIYQYYTDETKAPLFITDLASVPDASITPPTSNVIDGLAIKGDISYTLIDDSIRKDGIEIATSVLDSPEILTCRQNDDYIYILGNNTGGTQVQVEKFNVLTAATDGIIIDEITIAGSYPLRLTNNRIGFSYYDNLGALKFSVWDKLGVFIQDIDISTTAIGQEDWIASTELFFVYTSWNGASYDYNFVDEEGVSFGLVSPPLTDILPGEDFVNYRLGCIAVTGNQLWILTAVKADFSFWTVYNINVTYNVNSIPISISINSPFTFQKTTIVNDEYSLGFGWIHGQTL